MHKPPQPVRALFWLESEPVQVYQWTTDNGITVGLSKVNPKTDLEAAVAKAEAALADVSVSVDGTDVASDTLWVTAADQAIFSGAINTAKAVLANTDSVNADYEEAAFHLAQAYGSDGGQYGKYSNGNVYEDGLGFMTRAQLGTAG